MLEKWPSQEIKPSFSVYTTYILPQNTPGFLVAEATTQILPQEPRICPSRTATFVLTRSHYVA